MRSPLFQAEGRVCANAQRRKTACFGRSDKGPVRLRDPIGWQERGNWKEEIGEGQVLTILAKGESVDFITGIEESHWF